ncbi:DUF5123 domain-containing protein [bacterium]|nr:DUF5123 domain-containing protein [bacterium]
MNFRICIFLIFITSCTARGTEYFVSPAGSDVDAGSEAQPWQHIQYAVNMAVPGDTITVQAGIYQELVIFSSSGSTDSGCITLRAAPGNQPVLNGSGLAGQTDEPGLIRIEDQSYIRVIGLELCQLITADDDIFPAGIWITGASHHIEITDCLVHHIENNHDSDGGAHGIAVYGSKTDSLHHITIADCEIRDCRLGWSEALVLNGNVSCFQITDNNIYDCNNIAYDFIGHEGTCSNSNLDQARHGLVSGNIASNIDSRQNPVYGDEPSAGGFYVDGGRDIILERNRATACNIGIEIASEHSGKSSSGIIVRNNILDENHVIGLSMGGYDSHRGSTTDCRIVNNTFYHNNMDDIDWGMEFQLAWYCADNRINNNIFFTRSGVICISNDSGTGSNNSFDYNLYYSEGTALWIWQNNEVSSFQQFKTVSFQEAKGQWAEPLFTDSGEIGFIPSSGSATIDTGLDLGSIILGEIDYLENARLAGSAPDLGAIEYQGNTVVEANSNTSSWCSLWAAPSPFSSSVRFIVNLPVSAELVGYLYNVRGQVVKTWVESKFGLGIHYFSWNGKYNNGTPAPAGIYLFQLRDKSGSTEEVRVVLVR